MTWPLAIKITFARIVTVPFFIISVLYYSPGRDYLRYVALGVFLFAVISDVIDGYVARTRNQKTKAGAILDPLADKILLISAFICLYKMGPALGPVQFPVWLVVVVISRDVMLLIGSAIIFLETQDLVIEPSRWGKATTFFQVLCVVGVLLQLAQISFVWYAAIVLTAISGIDYIRNGIKILNGSNHETHF